MPTLQPSGRKRGILAPLLLITLFSIGGCQSQGTASEGTIGSESRWKIAGQAGPVALRSPGHAFWQRAIPGARVAPGSRIATFEGSRLELAGAGDEVTASGPSRFTLPDAEQNGVRVRQDAGSLRYKVRSAPKRRFEVKTPHFSTVVKGTSFLVSLDRASSAVVVDEGRVLILDPDGKPLAELTAGQTGRMAAQPGATFEVSAVADSAFEGAEPGAGLDGSTRGDTPLPQTTNGPGAPSEEPSFFERVESIVGDLAEQLTGGSALTDGAVDLDNEGGGGAREQERQSNAGNPSDGSHVDENGNGPRGRGGNGKGKGKGNGKGNGRGKGHGYGRAKAAGGGDAHILLDRDERSPLIAWSERR